MKMINSILIANRGEIASRIIRTCRKMGIRSIAVFSDADRNAPFVTEADLGVWIGESAPALSYLNTDKLIEVARQYDADAIHPGYGFLSENAGFARQCKSAGIIFIGPHPEAIEAMGSKSEAKALMQKHNVPVVPGYQGTDQKVETLKKAALDVGFPLLLKATAGGGGKGMRIVHSEKELDKAIEAAKREAMSAFGADELIIEKYITSGRHIEFQIFGDQQGNAIHLLERECSIQRRYQKVIEESPSPVLTEDLRRKMGEAAVNAAKALQYDNAGTVEFIFDDATQDFYFLEVNTRLQVEHPVTEAITGLDLVQWQIEVAQGMPLPLKQEEVKGTGYAVECRLYAEDAANDFMPVTGKVLQFNWPEVDGLRIDAGVKNDSVISIFYDPMIAKIIMWGPDRATVHRKMKYVLDHLVCQGLTTNLDFLRLLFKHPDFLAGQYNTHFIEEQIDLSAIHKKEQTSLNLAAIAATLHGWNQREQQRTLLRAIPSGWRNNFNDHQQESFLYKEEEIEVKYRFLKQQFHFVIAEDKYMAQLSEQNGTMLRIEVDGVQHTFNINQDANNYYLHNSRLGNFVIQQKARFPERVVQKTKGAYEAPMPSNVVKILVKTGQKVAAGEGLIVLSSMKMENTLEADEAGVVEEIFAEEGANVEAGFLLLKLKEE
jgi:acetyl-CoA carboxylase biotin carboxylase subunit